MFAGSDHMKQMDRAHAQGPVIPAVLLGILRQGDADSARTGEPSATVIAVLRESGLLGTAVPAEYGGAGGDAVACNRVVEEAARANPSVAIILFQHFAVSARISEWGTDAQKARCLPMLASGTWLAASAWSETGAGAGKKNINSTGVRQADGSWQLSGEKSFATSAGLADLYLVLVRTSAPQKAATAYGADGQTFFLVAADNPGIVPDLSLDLAGMRGSATGFVSLKAARVGDEDRLGPLGGAPTVIAGVRETGATLGAVALGIAQAAYDIAVEYVQHADPAQRFSLQYRLVRHEVMLEAARALVMRAGYRSSPDPGLLTLRSKLYACEVAELLALDIARMLGSTGYMLNHRVNRLIADARAVGLMGPTSELCQELLAASWPERV